MPRKGHTPKQILNKLRQVELAVAGGKRVSLEVKEIGVCEHVYCHWRNEYGGLNLDRPRSRSSWSCRTRGSSEPSQNSQWTSRS